MHFEYTPFVIPLAFSAVIIVDMLVVAWQNRDEEVAPWFAASLIALLDLDRLRLVNDTYGQSSGDELLRAVSAACQKALRPFDIFGCLGSDEIAVLLPHLTATEAAEAGRRLRDAVGALQVTCGDHVLGITACVGVVAVAHLTDEMLSGLLHQVEQALRAAKQDGPGRVVCAGER